MKTYAVNSPVVLFNHDEYGQRLLFQQGVTNPRDMLGKNGVNIHSRVYSFFYKTIRVQAPLVDEFGYTQSHEFNINRNSLLKYLGDTASTNDSDDLLIEQLNNKLWHGDNNSNEEDEQKQTQTDAGTYGLRHAGRHNDRPIDRWQNAFGDFIKGSFLSWLYQKTITGTNRIKIRFFLVSKEKDLFEAGEVLAKKRFHEAYAEVPAYTTHININGQPVDDSRRFYDIPKTTKENYIKHQDFDEDTHRHGKYPIICKTDTSTGTTGKPAEWVRSEQELETVKKSLQLAAKIQFGSRRLNYINAFALGPWATGLTTYELMRDTGSVFASGPDKEKIFDKLLRVSKYERRQLERAVDFFAAKHLQLSADDKKEIISLIDAALKTALKHRDAKLKDVINTAIINADESVQLLQFSK